MAVCLQQNVHCSKCRTYQMRADDWLLLLGRQYASPMHDYLTRDDTACNSCWRWNKNITKEWVSPSPVVLFTCDLLHLWSSFTCSSSSSVVSFVTNCLAVLSSSLSRR